MPEIKRVTLHPLHPDGSIDESINLYPKTLITGIVDENGNPLEGTLFSPADKALLDSLGSSIEIYDYFYGIDEIAIPNEGSPKYVIRQLSKKGCPDNASGIYHFNAADFAVRGNG